MFKCDKCGICCTKLNLTELSSELNRGDGVCKYFDKENRICTIYDNRPIICNVDAYYNKYLLDVISLEEYYTLNKNICKKLKKEENKL